MHESREMLHEQIRSKRASEGLNEIPDDLIAKKPRHDVSTVTFSFSSGCCCFQFVCAVQICVCVLFIGIVQRN